MYREGRQFPQETLNLFPEDYYAILDVSPRASKEEIDKAFRRLSRKCHPDLFPGDKAAEEQFKKINEARQILSDAQKRRDYDQSRIQSLPVQEQELSNEFIRTERIEGGFVIGFYNDGMKCLINPANKKRTRAFNPNVLVALRQGILIVKEGRKELYIKSQTMTESAGFDRIIVEGNRVVGYNLNLFKKVKSRQILDFI